MKTTLFLMSLFLSLPTWAGEVTGAKFAEGRVLSVGTICAGKPNCRTMGGIKVDVLFQLGGCQNRFGGYVKEYDTESNTLFIAGTALVDSDSSRIRCKNQATKIVSITEYKANSRVNVVFLGEESTELEVSDKDWRDARVLAGRVSRIKELCTQANCKSRGTFQVDITFELVGCDDEFAGAAHYYDRPRKTLYVVGLGMRPKASGRSHCGGTRDQEYSVRVRGGAQNMKVEFLPMATKL